MIQFELEHPTLRLAVVVAKGVKPGSSPKELHVQMQLAEETVRADPLQFPELVRTEMRNVLRLGGYKPTGRGKPASEFLLGAALGAGLPRVNNLVDINNLVSLRTALPISMFDLDHLGSEVSIRFGRTGERYVFNASGQQMDLAGIPVVCRNGDEPVGNAVKDSMLAKVSPETRNVTAVVYGSSDLPAHQLEQASRQLVELLRAFAEAETCESHLPLPKASVQ